MTIKIRDKVLFHEKKEDDLRNESFYLFALGQVINPIYYDSINNFKTLF